MERIFRGSSPSASGELVTTSKPPEGVPFTPGPDRPEEFAPGLAPELWQMVEQVSQMSRV